MGADWDPRQYERFREERSQPFFDLLALVEPVRGGRVVDLGCGTGELTQVLHERIGAAETLGIDTSPAMLARARERESDGLRFALEDIATFAPGGGSMWCFRTRRCSGCRVTTGSCRAWRG